MKMKRFTIIVTALLVFTLFSPAIFATDTASATTDDGNGGLVERSVIVYDLQELQDNPAILENRYIYYPERFHNWDVVVTYNIYNPGTQYTDDVLFRFDFKIGNLLDLYN